MRNVTPKDQTDHFSTDNESGLPPETQIIDLDKEGNIRIEEPKSPELNEHELLQQLKAAASAETRVRIFAKFVDTYGLEALVGLFFPVAGDIAASTACAIYILAESKNAGIEKKYYKNIIIRQILDSFVGFFPFIGDIADYFFKANKNALKLFEQRTDELIKASEKIGILNDYSLDIKKNRKELIAALSKKPS